MNKYKVEITKTFCLDVEAENEEQAKDLAENDLIKLEVEDRQHYYQTRDTDFTVYDITNTDDPFNPLIK